MRRSLRLSSLIVPSVLIACACWHSSNGDNQGFYACMVMSWLALIYGRMR